jgi:hypothetical protein
MLTNSVDLLEKAIDCAKSLGIAVRTEVLDGGTGGYCRIGSKAYIFLDQALTAAEQLDIVMQVLQQHSSEREVALS